VKPPPVEQKPFSLAARVRSFVHAGAGLWHLIRAEHNARVHLLATLVVIGVAAWVRMRAEDWRWMICAVALVWITEALNTALEALCDVVSPAPHSSIRIAKDVAAGAVLIGAIAALLIGALTFAPYFRI
jgi:diacylglycerol kinase (ATP)